MELLVLGATGGGGSPCEATVVSPLGLPEEGAPKLGKMKQEMEDFFTFVTDSEDGLLREDVMIVSSSQCLVGI